MPVFAAMVGTLFTALGGFLLKMFVAKVAIRVAAVAAITFFGAALLATFNYQVAPLMAQAFNTQYGQVLGLAFPPIAGTCIAALLAIYAACSLYKLQVKMTLATAGV